MPTTESDKAAIRQGVRPMLARQANAIASIKKQIGCYVPADDVEHVFRGLRLAKVLKYDGDRYVVTHGAFWAAEPLLRAAEYSRAHPNRKG